MNPPLETAVAIAMTVVVLVTIVPALLRARKRAHARGMTLREAYDKQQAQDGELDQSTANLTKTEAPDR